MGFGLRSAAAPVATRTAFRQTGTMHGHSKLNGIGVRYIGVPKKFVSAGARHFQWWCGWPLPHVTLLAEFDRCWSNSATISEIRRKIGSFVSHIFVSHISASFKVIKSDANRSGTYDLWSYVLAFSR